MVHRCLGFREIVALGLGNVRYLHGTRFLVLVVMRWLKIYTSTQPNLVCL